MSDPAGSLDLNLIHVFCAVIETQSVTLAAQRLNLYGSKISYSLNKLREFYQDPLFLRRNSIMQPTAYALELYKSFKPALELIGAATEKPAHSLVNLAKQPRTLRIRINQILEMWMMDRVFSTEEGQNNNICYDFYSSYLPEKQCIELLRGKQIDIDIGFSLDSDSAIFTQRLFELGIVSVCGQQNSWKKDSITLAELRNQMIFGWISLAEAVEVERNFLLTEDLYFINKKYRSNSFLSLFHCLQKTNAFALIHLELAPLVCKAFSLRMVHCPELRARNFTFYANTLKSRSKDPLLQEVISAFSSLKRGEG